MEIKSGNQMGNNTTENLSNCHNNAHVNNILNFGSEDKYIPEWKIKCQKRGKPGTGLETSKYFRNCINWWCYDRDNYDGNGSISTVLYGNGQGKLDFGNCYGHDTNVYLNGTLISSSYGKSRKVIKFDYQDGSTLKIEEPAGNQYNVLQFNSFEVIKCYN